MNNGLMRISGMQRSSYFSINILYAMAPNSAGTTFSKAGCNTSLCSTGCSGTINNTPSARTRIVTREDVAMEIVEMISFSGFLFRSYHVSALTAQGIFILIRLPVINARYPPPAPSIGV